LPGLHVPQRPRKKPRYNVFDEEQDGDHELDGCAETADGMEEEGQEEEGREGEEERHSVERRQEEAGGYDSDCEIIETIEPGVV
jgi:hypothetical protein